AMILSSLMSLTAVTFTDGCLRLYSAISELKTANSWVDLLQPTQIDIPVGPFAAPVTAPATPAASARQVTATAAAARRLIIASPFGLSILSRRAPAARVRELGVDLLVDVAETGLQVLHVAGLPLRDEAREQVLVGDTDGR